MEREGGGSILDAYAVRGATVHHRPVAGEAEIRDRVRESLGQMQGIRAAYEPEDGGGVAPVAVAHGECQVQRLDARIDEGGMIDVGIQVAFSVSERDTGGRVRQRDQDRFRSIAP